MGGGQTHPPLLNLQGEMSPAKNDEKAGGNGGGLSSITIDDFGGQTSPKIVTEEKLQCYNKFKGIQCMVEGPEFSQDFSYFL